MRTSIPLYDEPVGKKSRMIDAGAEALREHMQGGKQLVEWASLPSSRKRKWREYAFVVLTAAEFEEHVYDEAG